ncbi:unnamed protein product [Adineta ricciae]|uniref:OTU domain-containing protein n=1 Tax=Adineta ricciae TaxID=249248 RepID=A0A815S9M7_ADIRI|nr:unnamed protein product [Adineta ricciae]
MNRELKFKRILRILERCSEDPMYLDEINLVVNKIQQIQSLQVPFEFHPIDVFDVRKHVVDVVAKRYLEKATDDVRHLIPVNVLADGNCLYNSIVLLMNDSAVTAEELRVRTIMELTAKENYYETTYLQLMGPIDIAIKSICKNYTFSELYEIAGLCNVLQCNIGSVYPQIDFQHYMALWNSVFRPVPPVIANCSIALLWSHAQYENNARAINNGTWSPNHFVPLVSTNIPDESEHYSNSESTNVTPQKQTLKNRSAVQIRMPEFQSSPSRRLRTNDGSIERDKNAPTISNPIQYRNGDNKVHQRQMQLEKKRQRSCSSRMSQTTEQHQTRLAKARERSRSSRISETEGQQQNRLEKDRERQQSVRVNETEEQRQNRLEQQRKLSKTSRVNKKIGKQPYKNGTDQNNVRGRVSIDQSWPEAISRELKETRLQEFLEQMSMSALAECTCAVCNIGTAEKDLKAVPVSQIPNIHLLEVSEELRGIIKHLNEASNASINSNMETIEDAESDIPTELQGLTIPEQKLISLCRHNSCIIKLQSPFHSATTAQTALKGNCITFLQDVPNIVDSLPLTLEDLCDTLKVIFIGARPPDRINLKRVLAVRKKRIIQALQWLKKYNILYQKITINIQNINRLPEDDVPECIMSTLEQNIGDEAIESERVGYVPDPLVDTIEPTATDAIPISNSGVLDVNGTSVSSEEISTYILNKIKKNTDQTNAENVYLIPHSTKPVNEYFNPKLLAGLYSTLFCYGIGAPEDQSRPVKVNIREHIRYLLSYNDRRFETNHSFIFVVFNLLQRCDACFHARWTDDSSCI